MAINTILVVIIWGKAKYVLMSIATTNHIIKYGIEALRPLVLNINETQISIKAKTMEEQDSIGERKAIATQSVVLLVKE